MAIDKRLIAGEEYLKQLKQNRRGHVDDSYYPKKLPDFNVKDSQIELLAYYLPQFHPFPENDEWWGKGFTEWTNVTKARPQFAGHYQPQLPSDLGFYDLRNEETMEQQIELAKAYGLSGFIFYYYWFDGRRVLEKPLDMFMKRKDFDFKFSLCWANENWTRRWDGAENEVLLGQTHTPESDERFIRDVIKYMEDPRYIEIDGRPLLTIYRIGLLPELEATVKRWRQIAKELLGKDLFLVYAMTFGEKRVPETIGFDAAIQFPPHGISAHNITQSITPFSDDYSGNVFDYEDLAANARSSLGEYDFPVIPGVFPSWDNTARRAEKGHLYIGSSPDSYGAWLAEAAYHAFNKPVAKRSIVVINAWNEWAEGAHLEPDQKFGHAFLRTSADILRPYLKQPTSNRAQQRLTPSAMITSPVPSNAERTAIIVHAHYAEPLEEILKGIPENRHQDVFITLAAEPNAKILATVAIWAKNANLLFFPNRGRDIRPFLGAIDVVKSKGYRYFIKIHTKKSVHRSDGNQWSEALTKPFLAAISTRAIETYLEANRDVALVAPAGHVLDGVQFMGSAQNFRWLQKMCEHFGLALDYNGFQFVAGSMFAGRVSDLMVFANDGWLASMFEEEMGRRDGTLAHAMERMFGLACHQKGTIIALLDANGAKITRESPIQKDYQYAQTQSWHATAG